MLIPKKEYIRDNRHRKFIASLPCCVSGNVETQAAHIRSNNGGGMGLKPCDSQCVPLSWIEHARQHTHGEEIFWKPYGGIEKAKQLASDLYAVSGDLEAGKKLVREFRK